MKRKTWTLGAGALLLASLLAWALWPQATPVETVRLTRGDFVREWEEDARTRVRERYTVSAPLAGHLERPRLQPGDVVTSGQTVARIWPAAVSLLDARSQGEQQARVAAMQATLARAQANAARAESAEQQAQADLDRQSALATQGFIAASQREHALAQLEQRVQETAMARQERRAAEHDLARLRIGLALPGTPAAGPWPVRSPVAGRVLKLHRDSEGPVTPGAALLDLGNPRALEVVCELLTQDAASLPAQALATLEHWGGPATLRARLTRIEPGAFTKVSALGVEEQRVRAIFEPLGPWPEDLGDGYRMDIRIVVQQASQVPLAPVSAVFPHGQGHAVFVVEQGRARLHPVALLGRNSQQAWLQTTLPEGSVLIAYPSAALRPGERVTRRAP